MSLAGCGQPTIDATTDKSFSSTLIQVRSAVKERDLKLFDETIGLALKDIKYMKESKKEGYKWALKRSKSLGSIHGLTSTQIVSLGIVRESEGKETARLKLAETIAGIENDLLTSRTILESERLKVSNIKIVNTALKYVSRPSSSCKAGVYLCDSITVEFDIINNSGDILFDLSVLGAIPIQGNTLRVHEKDLLLKGLNPSEMKRIEFVQLIEVEWQRDIDIHNELNNMASKLELNISRVSFIKAFHLEKLQQYIFEYEQSYAEAIRSYEEKPVGMTLGEDRSRFTKLFHDGYMKGLKENRSDKIHKALVYQSATPRNAEWDIMAYTNRLENISPSNP